MTQTIVSPSDLDIASHPDRPEATWRLLTVGVPRGWNPGSWRSCPPGSSPAVATPVACAMAVLLNAHRMRRGKVRSWTFRLKAGGSQSAWLTAQLPDDGWQPKSPYDIPPFATEIKAQSHDYLEAIVEQMNESCGPTERVVVVMPLDHTADLFACLPESPDEPRAMRECQCHADSLQMANWAPGWITDGQTGPNAPGVSSASIQTPRTHDHVDQP